MARRYLKISDITQDILHKVTTMSKMGISQKDIAASLEFGVKLFQDSELIREYWIKGNTEFRVAAQEVYGKMVLGGDNWPAMRHFYATQMGIVEPKEAIIIKQEESKMTDEQALAIQQIMQQK